MLAQIADGHYLAGLELFKKVWADTDFGAGQNSQGDLVGAETVIQARGQGADQIGIRVLIGIVHMGRGDDDSGAISHSKASDVQSLVNVAGTVVYAGQDVAVQIDHKEIIPLGR